MHPSSDAQPPFFFWSDGGAEEPVGVEEARASTFVWKGSRLVATFICFGSEEREPSAEWEAFIEFLAERAVARCMAG